MTLRVCGLTEGERRSGDDVSGGDVRDVSVQGLAVLGDLRIGESDEGGVSNATGRPASGADDMCDSRRCTIERRKWRSESAKEKNERF